MKNTGANITKVNKELLATPYLMDEGKPVDCG